VLPYALKRIQLGIIAILIVSVFVFIAVRLSGDVSLMLVATDASAEELAAVRHELGLDRPLPVQYALFVERVFVHGDFGMSMRYGVPALDVVLGRLPGTIQLAGVAFVLALFLGIGLGVVSALNQGRAVDKVLRSLAALGQATPNFWIGMMLVLVFAVHLRWFPTSGRGSLSALVLPAITLAIPSIASILRITRSAMIDALGSESVNFLRVMGTPERDIVWKHALRNALIPVVALAGIQLGVLVGGALIVEIVFSWPGLGTLLVDAINRRDYSLIQASVFVTSTFLIFLNLMVDLLFGVIDPRISYR
jgi:ABC-type dipeptide/oligopeptide/nickel transport system permease component